MLWTSVCLNCVPGSPGTSVQSQCWPCAPVAASAPSGCSARPAGSSPEPPAPPAHVIIRLQLSAELWGVFFHKQGMMRISRLKTDIMPNKLQLFFVLLSLHIFKVCASVFRKRSHWTHCIKLFPFIHCRRASSHLCFLLQPFISCLTLCVFFLYQYQTSGGFFQDVLRLSLYFLDIIWTSFLFRLRFNIFLFKFFLWDLNEAL